MRSQPLRGGAGRWLAVEASAAGFTAVNAVTYPATLGVHAAHLAAWPTEGTLRVAALLWCTRPAAAPRYLVAVPTPAEAR